MLNKSISTFANPRYGEPGTIQNTCLILGTRQKVNTLHFSASGSLVHYWSSYNLNWLINDHQEEKYFIKVLD